MEGIGRRFGANVAVAGMDLSVHAGEFVSFLGPSGCGKSTALKMIAGLLAPSEGTIRIAPPGGEGWGGDGAEQHGGGLGEHDLGFVFQEPTLMPWATVLENVRLPLRLAGAPRADGAARARAALREVGLAGSEGAYPRQLSGGMKMRVSIARAMVTRPRILLMDEPFAALDEMTRMKLNDDVARLSARHGLTVIFVTHSVYEAVYLSARIVVMAARPGRVAAEIEVAAPWPRGRAFREAPAFADEARRVSRILGGTLDAHAVDH